jgi:drug/metabolite transporter (DMT)-like permease/DNA polymerase III epsilon subunit-like protein
VRILLAYLTVFIVWGSTYLVIRIGVRDLPPALFASSRFLIAGGIALTLAAIARRRFPATAGEWATQAAVGSLLLFVANGLVVWSEQWVPSGFAALIVATVPLFVAAIDSLLPRGDRLGPVGWTGLFIGLAGVALLVVPGLSGGHGVQIEPKGVLALLVASLSWSSGSVLAKRRPVNCDFFVAAGIQGLTGGLLLAAVGLATGEAARFHLTERAVVSILYLAVLGSLLGYSAYVYLLRAVPPAKAATYAYVNPVVAVVLGAIVLSEPLNLQVGLAAAVILGGVAMVQASRVRGARRRSMAVAADGESGLPRGAPAGEAPLAQLRLERPLAVFDLETTGLYPQKDRIVEIAIVKVHPDGRREVYARRVNPGVPIPPEVSRIHGIRDEDVAGEPRFKEVAAEVLDLLSGCDFAGFNVERYDLPLLQAEFVRAGLALRIEGRAILDASSIFHRKEPRHLAAAYRFYCGRDLAGAHSAQADAEACVEILDAQLARYDDLPRDAAGLHAWSHPRAADRVDLMGKFVWVEQEACFSFGKNQGRRLSDVASSERSYLDWLVRADGFPPDAVEIVQAALRGEFPRRDS